MSPEVLCQCAIIEQSLRFSQAFLTFVLTESFHYFEKRFWINEHANDL